MNLSASKIREAAALASVTDSEQDTLRTAALLLADYLEGTSASRLALLCEHGRFDPHGLDDFMGCPGGRPL